MNISMKLVLLAVAAFPLIGLTNASDAQVAGRASDRDVIELTADNFCRSQNSPPDVREMLDRLRITPASLCQCIVTEVSYSMDRTQLGADWADFIYRSHAAGNTLPQNARDQRAFTGFQNAYGQANRTCASRLSR